MNTSTSLVAITFACTILAAGCGNHSRRGAASTTAAASSQSATNAATHSGSQGGAQAPGPLAGPIPTVLPGQGFPSLPLGATTPGAPATPALPAAPATPAAPAPAAPVPAAPAPAAPAPAAPAPQPSAPEDTDRDGLSDQQELALGTNPRDDDSDGDGIIDGRDLAPLYGAADYGPFGESYPAGALSSERTFRAVGLRGRSRIKNRLTKKTTYQGTKGTRSSTLDVDSVRAALNDRFAGEGLIATRGVARGGARRLERSSTTKKAIHKEYGIDYDLMAQDYSLSFRNEKAGTRRDAKGRPFANRAFPVKVHGGLLSTLVVQVALDPGADRTNIGQNDYTLPAASYQVYAGKDLLQSEVVLDEVSIGTVLNTNAYELRLPLKAPQGSGPQDWTVVVTPLWVSRTGNGPIEVEALPARALKVGAAAHDLRVTQAAGRVARLLGIYRSMRGFSRDLRAESLNATYQQVKRNERRVISQNDKNEWVLTSLAVTARLARIGNATLVFVDEQSKSVKGKHLTDMLDPTSARRYLGITNHLLSVSAGASAVIEGTHAVVAFRQGDTVRALSFTARAANSAYVLADSVGLVNANRGVTTGLSALSSGLDAYQAFKSGQNDLGVVHLARGSASIARLFVAGKSVRGIPATGLLTVAVGIVDVGFNVHRATKASDPILKQAYVEQAAAAAVDVGISVIPTVGPVVQVVWRGGWAVVTLIAPDLAAQRMWSSPGASVTFVGQVIFTNSIPSAYAEMAYEKAAKAAIKLVVRLEDGGTPATLVLPQSGTARANPAPFVSAPTSSTSKRSQAYQAKLQARAQKVKTSVGNAARKTGGAFKKAGAAVKNTGKKVTSAFKKAGAAIKNKVTRKSAKKPAAPKPTATVASAKTVNKPSFFSRLAKGIKSKASAVKAKVKTSKSAPRTNPTAPTQKKKKSLLKRLFRR